MMYYYWSRKGIRPSVFHSMPIGEKTVIMAFYQLEIEQKKKFVDKGADPSILW